MIGVSDDAARDAVRELFASVQTLRPMVRGREGAAALRALEASVTLVLLSIRPSPITGAREAALHDLCAAVAELRVDDVGTDAIPTRYDTGGRETLDRMRDLLGDHGFAAGCLFNVIKYLDRAGKKGDAARDEAKALFYLQAAAHVLLGLPDPRVSRPRHTPYEHDASTTWPPALLDLASRVHGGASRVDFLADLLTAYVRGAR